MKFKLYILFFLITTSLFAQKVTTSLDTTRNKIGAEFQLTLKASVNKKDKVVFRSTIHNGMWTACGRKYYTKWKIRVDGVIIDELNLDFSPKIMNTLGYSEGFYLLKVNYGDENSFFNVKHIVKH